ncbi:MAG: putative phage abortive infection protein [Henriciella sp.]
MSKTEKSEVKTNTKGHVIFAIAAVLIFGVWILNFFAGLDPKIFNGRGTFGDSFGISNSLFSGLALAGVIYAIILQRAEIGLTRQELRRTKDILDQQSKSLKLQNEETKKQIFENTFFQLLRVFSDLTEGLDLAVDSQTTATGKDVFMAFERRLTRIDRQTRKTGATPDHKETYRQLYRQAQNDLGHYFRMLYTILKSVDESSVDNKKFYTNIIRAQLSNAELHMILYNGVSDHGKERLKPLLETYEFFDNLPLDSIFYQDALKEYEIAAFGKNQEILSLVK